MKCTALVLPVVVLLIATFAIAGETEGPLAHYSFDRIGAEGRVEDQSGNERHAVLMGDAIPVDQKSGRAAQFNGIDTFLAIPLGLADLIDREITVEVSCKPQSAQGGIFSFSTGQGWADERFVLATNTYSGANSFLAVAANGRDFQIMPQPPPVLGQWTHFVVSARGNTFRIFRDGVLAHTAALASPVDVKGSAVWIGRCQGLGAEFFQGQIDDVRIFNRAIGDEQALELFKQHVGAAGRDEVPVDRPQLDVRIFDEPGWIVVDAQAGYMRPLPQDAVIRVLLFDRQGEVLAAGSSALENDGRASVTIIAASLVGGEYEVRGGVDSPDGKLIGQNVRRTVNWPGRNPAFANVRVLNNLVWELLNLKDIRVGDASEIPFHSPKTRWLILDASVQSGRVEFFIDGDALEPGAMRHLPAGDHLLKCMGDEDAVVSALSLRSIPELIYSEFQSEPWVSEFGPFRGEFLEKYVLPHVNTLVIGRDNIDDPFVPVWRQLGGRWLVHATVPGLKFDGVDTGAQLAGEEAAYGFVASTVGYTDPRVDGSIADEFGDSEPHCALYAAAIRRAAKAPEFAGKVFYPYVNALYNGAEGRRLVQAVIDTGGALAWKNYLPTQPDEASARQFIKSALIDRANQYRALCPGSVEHIAVCFGYFSAPPEFLNVHPNVNYKKYLDMQFNAVANDPAFWGCYGLMSYLASYADEETVRWTARLFRHYGIEGATAAMCDEPYVLPHLVNGDFTDGTAGWDVSAARDDSVSVVTREGLSWLQGRYPRTSVGDTALRMVRDPLKPNQVSQEIVNLKPGELYSLRFISADGKDFSPTSADVITAHLDGTTILSDRSFVSPQANCYSHHLHPYDDKRKAHFNYHWILFRADSTSARLTISDHAGDAAGGDAGQELLLNGIQAAPYFAP